jgi:hypothetical protein
MTPTLTTSDEVKSFVNTHSKFIQPTNKYRCGFGVSDNTEQVIREFEFLRDYIHFHSNFKFTLSIFGREPNGKGKYQGMNLKKEYANKVIYFVNRPDRSVRENSERKWEDKSFREYREYRIQKRSKMNKSRNESLERGISVKTELNPKPSGHLDTKITVDVLTDSEKDCLRNAIKILTRIVGDES